MVCLIGSESGAKATGSYGGKRGEDGRWVHICHPTELVSSNVLAPNRMSTANHLHVLF